MLSHRHTKLVITFKFNIHVNACTVYIHLYVKLITDEVATLQGIFTTMLLFRCRDFSNGYYLHGL